MEHLLVRIKRALLPKEDAKINYDNLSESESAPIIPNNGTADSQCEDNFIGAPHNYDAWLDYLLLIEKKRDASIIRTMYERAITNVPLVQEKDSWRTYISIWIAYALYEETISMDIQRTRQVYKACLEVISHQAFSFGKVWLLYARFEVRCNNSAAARSVLNQAMCICPSNKLLRGFINMEAELGEIERCRVLYRKLLESQPECCATWTEFADMETSLGEIGRARAIYKLAATRSRLDIPAKLWDAYVAFEMEYGTGDSAKEVANIMPKRGRYNSMINCRKG